MARSAGTASRAGAGGSDASAPIGRVPPHDLEAEKAVLSALLLDNDAIHSVYTEVVPEDFYHPAHRQLYLSMLSLQDANQPVDLHTLADYLNSQKTLDAIGGPMLRPEHSRYRTCPDRPSHATGDVDSRTRSKRVATSARRVRQLKPL